MTTKQVLNTKFYCSDFSAKVTLKEYFKQLLFTVWVEGEEFSGKRPFGDSSWDYTLAYDLIVGGIYTKGEINEYGEPEFNYTDFDAFIKEAIRAL